jgi:hypothetical protein
MPPRDSSLHVQKLDGHLITTCVWVRIKMTGEKQKWRKRSCVFFRIGRYIQYMSTYRPSHHFFQFTWSWSMSSYEEKQRTISSFLLPSGCCVAHRCACYDRFTGVYILFPPSKQLVGLLIVLQSNSSLLISVIWPWVLRNPKYVDCHKHKTPRLPV